jgi:hypothetical protein
MHAGVEPHLGVLGGIIVSLIMGVITYGIFGFYWGVWAFLFGVVTTLFVAWLLNSGGTRAREVPDYQTSRYCEKISQISKAIIANEEEITQYFQERMTPTGKQNQY